MRIPYPMARKRATQARPTPPITTTASVRGTRADQPDPVVGKNWRRSIRGICRDLVNTHSTEINRQLRDGITSKKKIVALKYLTFVAAYESGKPVETHRMVGLQEGPAGTYDLTKLNAQEQKDLLVLLRKAKDTTDPSSGNGGNG